MENPEFDNGDHFAIEDLLNFPKDDGGTASADKPPAEESPLDKSSLPHFHGIVQPGDALFTTELCLPYDDDVAELEWLSRFVDESFSSEDMQKLHLIQGINAQTDEKPEFQPATTGPIRGKARSKRSRAAPGSWTSRVLAVSPETEFAGGKSEGRRCLHCASDKTPQWRSGPMGPKTLCNACGVRYKSGRLVPEYRPASSPTFVVAKHSNSHRKVLEMRRQKEVRRQFLHQLDVSNGDYYRQLI